MLANAGGIDFGTSNSSVGYLQAGKPVLVDFGNDGPSVPSAIFYATESSDIAFGKQAVAQYTDQVEGRLLRSLKSVLGSSLMGEKTTIGNKRVPFGDIIADFFGYLRYSVTEQGTQDISHVVVGRPVYFVDDDAARDAQAERELHDIATRAGFAHVEFQFEPIAAALSYEQVLTREELALVVDIGGGTADFTLIRLSPNQHSKVDRTDDILATTGMHIGGTDFDRLLSLKSVMPQLGMGSGVKNSTRVLPQSVYFDLATWHRIPLLYNTATLSMVQQMKLDAVESHQVGQLLQIIENRHGHALARAVELAKITLSDQMHASLNLATAEAELQAEVHRADFENAIAAALERLTGCVIDALACARIQAESVTSVFYTGGSSSVPLLQQQFNELFPAARRVKGDTFGSVGLGLTIDAARKFA